MTEDYHPKDHPQRTGLSFVFLIAITVCQLLTASQQEPLLILYAFTEEGTELARQMTIEQRDSLYGRPVFTGMLSGKRVIVAESGIGMTNAAMMAQALIDMYRPSGLVFSGIAGGIDSSVAIGDIIVCDSWATHDYLYLGRDSAQVRPIRAFSATADSIERTLYFVAAPSFIETARVVATEKSRLEKIGDRYPRILIGGHCVSGNAFVDNAEKRIWLQQEFSAKVTDMESAAVAQVCSANGVPFIVFRSASDLAGGTETETARQQLEQFFEVAARNSATVVIRFVALLQI